MRDPVAPSSHRVWSAVYVIVVGALAAVGFIAETPWPILLAACVTLPVSVVAVPGYYLVYGLLAWVSGANPSQSTGSGTSFPDGTVASTETGSLPAWFTLTTSVIGVLIFAGAAVVNLYLLRRLRRRRGMSTASPPPAEGDRTGY